MRAYKFVADVGVGVSTMRRLVSEKMPTTPKQRGRRPLETRPQTPSPLKHFRSPMSERIPMPPTQSTPTRKKGNILQGGLRKLVFDLKDKLSPKQAGEVAGVSTHTVSHWVILLLA
jgi:hypothetical protein